MSQMRELIEAGNELVLHLDYPPKEAEAAQKEATKALRGWRRLVAAVKAEARE